MNKNDKYFIINGEEKLMYSGYYKSFTAEYCRFTGKPMLSNGNYKDYADKWLSPSRCKKIGKPVIEGEEPVAFYRVMNGYCGLYDRENIEND